MIGDSIEVKVIGIEGDLVRIGITAPKNVDIYRREVYLAIKEENELASKSKVDPTTLKQLMTQARNQSGEE
jgi:carbon storage regulator